MELGLTSFAETIPAPGGEPVDHGKRLRQIIEEIVTAEDVGLDVYGLGEHHRPDFAASAPAIVLAAAAGKTSRIRLFPAVSILSTDDPVRVFQQYATLDLLSGGRAEIMAGRGSFTESFPLFGYDLADYDELFAEKLTCSSRSGTKHQWSGRFRPPIMGQSPPDDLPIRIAVGGPHLVRAAVQGSRLVTRHHRCAPDQFRAYDLYRKTLVEHGETRPSTRSRSAHGFRPASDKPSRSLPVPW